MRMILKMILVMTLLVFLYSSEVFAWAGITKCPVGSPCHENAVECNIANDTMTCVCKQGFAGLPCEDIDECHDSPCDTNAECTNTEGFFICSCEKGFQGNGYTCEDANECDMYPCGINADCTNTEGSYTCSCKNGFVGNGYVCKGVPKWDYLSVTFPKYNELPMEEIDAKSKGWELYENNCINKSGPFVGKRYMLHGDRATILIFDYHGHIAGMQMSYKGGEKAERMRHDGAYKVIGDWWHSTTYFTEPLNICDKDKKRSKAVIGDKLLFMNGTDEYMEAPLFEKDIASTKWIKGKCFHGMGMHYWYNVSTHMNCNDMFPSFLMYNKYGQLYAWGFSAGVHIPGDRVEHPTPHGIQYFFQKETKPLCLPRLDHRSTEHVYFTKMGYLTHPCPRHRRKPQ